MNKTSSCKTENPIAVDINSLSSMLSCGHHTARRIAEDAHATIRINRRVLYSVDKVRKYIEDISI